MNHLELQEFFVEGKEHQTSHVLLHITEPNTAEEYARGYFFALIEISHATIGRIEKFQKMIDDIETGYYGTDQETGKEQFEAILELINRRSEQLLDNEGTVDALVGVIKHNTLMLAAHGTPQALLFYRDKQDFATVNILDGGQTKQSSDIFPSVLQGTLNAGDFILVATPHLIEYFTADRLQKLITSRSIKQSSEHIHKVLSDMSSAYSFGGIMFRMLPHTEKIVSSHSQKNKSPQGSEASLNKLVHAKQETTDTLYPPIFQHLLRGIKQQVHKPAFVKAANATVGETKKIYKATSEEPRDTPTKTSQPRQHIGNTVLIGFGRALVTLGIGVGKMMFMVIRGIIQSVIGLFILITNKNNSRQDVLRSIETWCKNIFHVFGTLPFISKLLFILTILAIIVLSGSVAMINIRKGYAEKQAYHTDLMAAVQQKKDAAEASIIYEDTAAALTLLQEARVLLDQLPDDDKKIADGKKQLIQRIQESLQKVQKMKTVTPEQVVVLSQQYPNVHVEKMVRIDDTLLAFGANTPTIYRTSLSTKRVQETSHDAMAGLYTASTPKEQDTTVFMYANNSVALYQKDAGVLSTKTIAYPGTAPNIVDAFVYNVKLYTLDTAGNQIYKHNKTQTGYDKGTPWIKTSVDLSQAVSLAIDGDMFVLTKNGNILKFTRGEQQEFTISGLEPTLEGPIQIWTYNEVNHIYILEPKGKRVVVLDKAGKLIQQYTSLSWINPTGMVVDETNKIIYILDQQTISSFILP